MSLTSHNRTFLQCRHGGLSNGNIPISWIVIGLDLRRKDRIGGYYHGVRERRIVSGCVRLGAFAHSVRSWGRHRLNMWNVGVSDLFFVYAGGVLIGHGRCSRTLTWLVVSSCTPYDKCNYGGQDDSTSCWNSSNEGYRDMLGWIRCRGR